MGPLISQSLWSFRHVEKFAHSASGAAHARLTSSNGFARFVQCIQRQHGVQPHVRPTLIDTRGRSRLPTAPSTHSRRSPDTPAVPPGGAPALHRPITRHPNPLSRTNVDGIATGLLSDIPHPCPVRPATRPGWPEACGSARPAHTGGVPSSAIAAARRAVIAASIACTADSSPMSSTSAPAPPARTS
jgi:hypothetical protein